MRPKRLMGLETEYALRYRSVSNGRPSDLTVYERLISCLSRRMLTVPAKNDKTGHFLESGAAVWFEHVGPGDLGFIETATPECYDAAQVITCQRALDHMLADCLQQRGNAVLLKNCRSREGLVYGAQESYQATLGNALHLLVWRCGLILMFPCLVYWSLAVIVSVISIIALCLTVMLNWSVLMGLALLIRPLLKSEWRPPKDLGFSNFMLPLENPEAYQVRRRHLVLDRVVIPIAFLLAAPVVIPLTTLARLIAFRRIRRQLQPFLVSRAVIAGSGWVDQDGRFHLSEKSSAVASTTGFGARRGRMALFNMGPFLKAVMPLWPFAYSDYRALFAPRQRLQISLGDSNMCEDAEYLRLATTALVLDAIEHGDLRIPAKVVRPAKAVREIVADPSLRQRVLFGDGSRKSALEIQRFYWTECQRYVAKYHDTEEAHQILELWKHVLDALQRNPRTLVGHLDWVTKRYLLEQSGRELSWQELKKIDIRYHELSDDGYYSRLMTTGVCHTRVCPQEREQAEQAPPSGSPASQRVRLMRDHIDCGKKVRATWRSVVLGKGPFARVLRVQ